MGIAITYAIANLAVLGLFFYVTYRNDQKVDKKKTANLLKLLHPLFLNIQVFSKVYKN